MKQRSFLLLIFSLLITAASLNAQSCDPWIVKAYNQLYGRGPSAEECNIKNYNNGSWRSYVELVGHIAGYNRYRPGNHLKGDPWIFMAYSELYNRAPKALELNIRLYNKGTWSSYDDLKKYVQETQKNFATFRTAIKQIVDKRSGKVLTNVATSVRNAIAVISNEEGRIEAKGQEALNSVSDEAKKRAAAEAFVDAMKKVKGLDVRQPGKRRVLSADSEEVLTSGDGALIVD